MELIYDYMLNHELRHKLNELTQKTFGFDFESWVTGGYFEGDYVPYSFMEDGKIISNVSANRMCFMQNGVKKEYIQIGTVMTDETYRNQGLAKKLMEYVVQQYKDKCDGFYLFADLSALDFYRKADFTEGMQYQYRLKLERYKREISKETFLTVDENNEQMKQKYMDAVRHSAVNASLEQMNKFGLQMFYTSDMSNVYYAEDIDCFVVMEMEEDMLILESVICKEHLSLKEIIKRIDNQYDSLILGFSPCAEDRDMFDAKQFEGGEDYRLFYRGKDLESIQKDKIYFPQLSHA